MYVETKFEVWNKFTFYQYFIVVLQALATRNEYMIFSAYEKLQKKFVDTLWVDTTPPPPRPL